VIPRSYDLHRRAQNTGRKKGKRGQGGLPSKERATVHKEIQRRPTHGLVKGKEGEGVKKTGIGERNPRLSMFKTLK